MTDFQVGPFEWDLRKELKNIRKHSVSFDEARLAFDDPHCVFKLDATHSQDEIRWFCFGKVKRKLLTVRFTRRGGRIRIFGAGEWKKGRKNYEKKESKKTA